MLSINANYARGRAVRDRKSIVMLCAIAIGIQSP